MSDVKYSFCTAKQSKEDFEPHFMKEKKKKEFDDWYHKNIEHPFLEREKLVESGQL